MDRSRKEKVREILLSKPFTSLQELIEKFPNVSSMTLRRDIEYFEEKGEVIKVRGGARAMHFITRTLEDSYYKRALENPDGKEKIATAAAHFIETGRSIFLDSGSTIARIVPHLPYTRLNITTTDPNVALALVKNEQAVVNITGGSLNRSNLSLSGNMALKFVENTNLDIAFVSPSGFSLECGFTSGNFNESVLKNAVTMKSHRVIMLVQSGKFNKSMPHTFATLQDIDVLITDEEPGDEIRKACEEAKVELIVTD